MTKGAAKDFTPKGTYYKYVGFAYCVISNSDLTQGRGRSVVLGYYTRKDDASQAAKGRGVFGSPAEVRHVPVTVFVPKDENTGDPDWNQALVIDEDAVVKLHRNWIDPKLARERALAKLSADERELLGLPDK